MIMTRSETNCVIKTKLPGLRSEATYFSGTRPNEPQLTFLN